MRQQVMVAGYLKTTCGVQQMVSNGNEGYRVQGAYDPYASTAYPFNVRLRMSLAYVVSACSNHCAPGIFVLSSCAWGGLPLCTDLRC